MRKIHINKKNNEAVSYTKTDCALMFYEIKVRSKFITKNDRTLCAIGLEAFF